MHVFCKTLFISLLFLNQLAKADEGYQFETTLGHYRYTSNSDYKFSDNNLDTTYYFSKVDPKTYPLQEAAFMARSSGIRVGLAKSATESTSSYTSDTASISLNAFYMSPDHPYVIAGAVSESKRDSSSSFLDAKSKSYAITPGYFLRDNLLLGASFQKSEIEYTSGGTFSYDTTSLIAKWLHPLPSGTSYNLVAAIARSNFEASPPVYTSNTHSTTVFLSGDYYFTRTFSLGTLVIVSDSNDSRYTGYGLSSTWFVNSRLFATLSGVKSNSTDYDAKSISLSLGMRL